MILYNDKIKKLFCHYLLIVLRYRMTIKKTISSKKKMLLAYKKPNSPEKNTNSSHKKTNKKEQYKKIVMAILAGLLGIGGVALYRHKIKLPKRGVPETNRGYQMLVRQGWTPGTPIGKSKRGITSPIKDDKRAMGSGTIGLGYKLPN